MQRVRVFLVISLLLRTHTTMADDAAVLPKGVWRVGAEARFSLPITKRFTADGGTEDLAADFNRELDSTVFPDLQRVETAFRLPAGSATFGRSTVDFERHIQIYTVQAAYGLTDRLALGLRIPYWTQQNTVKATLDSRTATVGFNPAVPGGVAPLRVPGTRPPTTEDIQAAVERLGFRRVEDWSDAGFSDLFGGLKYQYYRSAHWRLAVSGNVRFPTGRWDDPNNLVDYPTGFEAWGLGLQMHQDFVWHTPSGAPRGGVLAAGGVVLNTTFRYEAILPDTKPFRVCNVHQPLCPDFDPQVHRDVGDILEAEVAGTVGLLPGLTLTPQYIYTHKFQDHFRGDLGFQYGQLKAETDTDSHSLEVRLAYSTASLFAAQRFPVPLSVAVRYVERLASTNNRLQTRYVGFTIAGSF
ncbi:MAG: hypothetical protein AB7N91_31720 [Candidatus Tectimicrobiota bacterium]